MTEAETIAAVEAVFLEAGWKPLPDGSSIAGQFCAPSGPEGGWTVGGQFRGSSHVKLTWAAPDSPDTPNDPVEAARWLVGRGRDDLTWARADKPVLTEDNNETDQHGRPDSDPDDQEQAEQISVTHADESTTDLGQEIADWQAETGQNAGDDSESAPSSLASAPFLVDTGTELLRLRSAGDKPVRGNGGGGSGLEGSASSDPGHRGDARGDVIVGSTALLGDAPPAPTVYPGIAIERLSDELSIRRAQVIDRITAIEEVRLLGLEDRLAARDQAVRDYHNWPAGVPMDPHIEQQAREWMALDARASAIRKHASDLRRSARDASADILRAMWDGEVEKGWP